MSQIYPNNKLNATISQIIKNADSSIEEISKLEAYYEGHEGRSFEKEKLRELVRLKEQLEKIAELKYYKTPNN